MLHVKFCYNCNLVSRKDIKVFNTNYSLILRYNKFWRNVYKQLYFRGNILLLDKRRCLLCCTLFFLAFACIHIIICFID